MNRTGARALSIVLLSLSLLVAGCGGNVSGDSNPGTQTNETPAPPPS